MASLLQFSTRVQPKILKIENSMYKYQLNITNMLSKPFLSNEFFLTSGLESLKVLEILNEIRKLS